MKSRIAALLRRPFELQGVSRQVFERNVAFCRILFGIGILHRALDILGFTAAASNPSFVEFHSLLQIGLALLIIVGLFTPVALAALPIVYFIPQFFIWYLGPQVAVIVVWGLLLFGAGRTYSLDAVLARHFSWYRVLVRWLYVFAFSSGKKTGYPEQLAWVRFLLILMYWGTTVAAMVVHFKDPLWLSGEVLQLVHLTPYLTDHYAFFGAWSEASPWTYNIYMTASIFVQGTWEVFLLPLMFFRWTRLFVVVQGFLFFTMSILVLNLGYLPYIEFVWWFLLFNFASVLYLPRVVLYYNDQARRTISVVKALDFYDVVTPRPMADLNPAPEESSNSFGTIVFERKGKRAYGYRAYAGLCSAVFPFVLAAPLFLLGRIGGLGEAVYRYLASRRKLLADVREPVRYEAADEPSWVLIEQTGGLSRWLGSLHRYFFKPVVITLCVAACLSFFALHPRNPVNKLLPSSVPRNVIRNPPYRPFAMSFGQWQINVFNLGDLKLGGQHLAMYETTETGEILRLVPFMDIHGGRLDYLRNDLMYFGLSLQWQRRSYLKQFPDVDILPPDRLTNRLVRRVAQLDACIQGIEENRHYRTFLFKRELKETDLFIAWGEAKVIGALDLTINASGRMSTSKYCDYAFDLPPGQFNNSRRVRESEERIAAVLAASAPFVTARLE